MADNATIRTRLVPAPDSRGKGPRTSYGAYWRAEPGAVWQRVAGPYGPIVYMTKEAAEQAAREVYTAALLSSGPFGSQFGRRDITLGGHALARVAASPVRGADGIAHYPLICLLGPADVDDLGGLIVEALNAYPPALTWAREMLKKA